MYVIDIILHNYPSTKIFPSTKSVISETQKVLIGTATFKHTSRKRYASNLKDFEKKNVRISVEFGN